MSLWTRIAQAIAALRHGESLAEVFARLRTPPERSVGFAIAVIAIGAKMAKADGHVTKDEVTAFREVFHIAPEDEAGAAHVFNLARTDVAGFDVYARRIAAMFRDDPKTLSDLVEGLFHIALADGDYHPDEDEFLTRVAEIFGIPDPAFKAMRARFVPNLPRDPYTVLEVTPDTPPDEIRRTYQRLVRENHPDAMMSRGVPPEAVRLAERRMADINSAWEEIGRHRRGDQRHAAPDPA
ncbi:molecular chaperone DjiA [Chachezhania antarctica]|uniref:molecular chaperone DjiA n=1 Tax=Chachezhania antarctica TaxID=2340860 RepID=UPI000EAE0A0C|nr:molecular chaperone DjiA [Chachezhania antarctica]|tara:strand:- start:1557 stop:2270 length:714 start_codon:yes stop_codon:yes gene_type:complete